MQSLRMRRVCCHLIRCPLHQYHLLRRCLRCPELLRHHPLRLRLLSRLLSLYHWHNHRSHLHHLHYLDHYSR